jgi:diguanylate cyclase (GGDEF)-like protein
VRKLAALPNPRSRRAGEPRLAADFLELPHADPLTGLPTRRVLERRLACEFEEGGRKRRCSIVKVDIDAFWRYNGDLDPKAGDLVLFIIGLILKCHARRGDVAGRYGGDEFLVLLPRTGHRRALSFAERITWDVASQFTGDGSRLTVSCGVASRGSSMTRYGQLMESADGALHAAKCQGGNRVVVAHPLLSTALLERRAHLRASRVLRAG